VQSLTAHQAWLWGHAVNILAARDGLKVLPPSVAIAWSLSIEEQFYLVWPLIVWLASRAALRWVCVGCIVGAMLIRLAIATRWPTAAFTLMPARMDALALGGLIAICYRDPVGWRRVQRLWAPVGAAALTVIIVMYVVRGNMRVPDLGLSTIGYGSADWLSAALLVYALTTPVTVLTAPVLRFFGRYSYALYLLHLPVLLAMHPVTDWLVARPLILGSPLPWMMLSLAISIGATTCLALVSWILLERPFLSLKRYVPYGRSSGARPAIVAGPPTEPPLSVSSAL
jgi:peptidoglycan/LPS O-acetylase OafA/YrhL